MRNRKQVEEPFSSWYSRAAFRTASFFVEDSSWNLIHFFGLVCNYPSEYEPLEYCLPYCHPLNFQYFKILIFRLSPLAVLMNITFFACCYMQNCIYPIACVSNTQDIEMAFKIYKKCQNYRTPWAISSQFYPELAMEPFVNHTLFRFRASTGLGGVARTDGRTDGQTELTSPIPRFFGTFCSKRGKIVPNHSLREMERPHFGIHLWTILKVLYIL